MAATWPSAPFPQLLQIDAFSDRMYDGRLRQQTSVGPGKVRPRTYANVKSIRGKMEMTQAQWTQLETFIQTTLVAGSAAFNFPNPDDGGSTTILVQLGDEMPMRAAIGGNTFDVILDLEKLAT